MLVNWLVSNATADQTQQVVANSRNQKGHLVSPTKSYQNGKHNQAESAKLVQDLRQIMVGCCNCLLAAGVLKQIAGPQEPLDAQFRVSLFLPI